MAILVIGGAFCALWCLGHAFAILGIYATKPTWIKAIYFGGVAAFGLWVSGFAAHDILDAATHHQQKEK